MLCNPFFGSFLYGWWSWLSFASVNMVDDVIAADQCLGGYSVYGYGYDVLG